MSLAERSASYWSKPPFLFLFWYSGTLVLSPKYQSARMSNNKNVGLDQYDAECSEVWPFDSTGLERVKYHSNRTGKFQLSLSVCKEFC